MYAAARALDAAPAADRVAGMVDAARDVPGLDAADRAIVAFSVQLALHPGAVDRDAHTPLRTAGLDGQAIHDIVHVVACFSYMNRLADGTGVGLFDVRRELAVELLGEAAWSAHQRWAAPG